MQTKECNDDGVDLRSFSPIELAILSDIAAGYQSKEIAIRIGRSKPTVENYVRLLCAKLAARSRPHLVACAYREGVLRIAADAASA